MLSTLTWMGRWKMKRKTSSGRIIKVLHRLMQLEPDCGKTAYVMTDVNLAFFQKLRQSRQFKKVFFYDDFEELKALKRTDNYKLFCVENVIMRYAGTRVTTFKVHAGTVHAYLWNGASDAWLVDY